MVYRPTVRYDDCFKDYVDSLFNATGLDRNQIFRLALYLLPHTKEGQDVLTFFASSPLPRPGWNKNSMDVWYGETLDFAFDDGGGGRDASAEKESIPRSTKEAPRQKREIHQEATVTIRQNKIVCRLGNTIFYPG